MAFVCASLAAAACGPGHYSSRGAEEPEEEAIDPTLGWPKDAPGLLTHLNGYRRASLEAHERPDLDMSKHLAAETDGTAEWVQRHTEKLQALGVRIRWNPDARVYEREPVTKP